MKKGQVIINAVLLVGLAAIYILHFTGSSATESSSVKQFSNDSSSATGTIAYVNTDTIIANYDLAIDINAEIEGKYKTAQAELADKENRFMKEVQQLQYDAQRGLIKRSDAAKKQEELAQEEQMLYQRRNELTNELSEDQGVAFRQIYEDIVKYIEKYNADKGLTYVLGNQYGGGILYANKQLNITNDILDGLNKEYSEKKDK